MNATELRIGNYVSNQDGTLTDIPIGDPYQLKLSDFDEWLEFYTPIPLDETWLLKFGFKKSEYINNRYINDPIQIYYNDKDKNHNIVVHYRGMMVEGIIHAHQLQNLYFALTQKELEIK